MRWKAALLVGWLVPLAGCNQFYLAGRNLVNEPATLLDEHKLDKRLRAEARCAWAEVCRQYPARTFTAEFADGFRDGYAVYLDVGGAPQPPAIPPLRYRRSDYLNPDGHARIKDYQLGFRYGAEVAASTGQRQFLTVPVLVPEARPEPPLAITRGLPAGPVPAPPVVGPADDFVGPPVPPGFVPPGPVVTPPPAAPPVPPPPPKVDGPPAAAKPPVEGLTVPVSVAHPVAPVPVPDPGPGVPVVLPPVADHPPAVPAVPNNGPN